MQQIYIFKARQDSNLKELLLEVVRSSKGIYERTIKRNLERNSKKTYQKMEISAWYGIVY